MIALSLRARGVKLFAYFYTGKGVGGFYYGGGQIPDRLVVSRLYQGIPDLFTIVDFLAEGLDLVDGNHPQLILIGSPYGTHHIEVTDTDYMEMGNVRMFETKPQKVQAPNQPFL